MRKLMWRTGLLSLFALSAAAGAQDVVRVAPEHSKILLENEDIRVVQTTLAPGEKDPVHVHPAGWYYVVQPGTMKVTFADGQVATWESQAGEGGWLKTRAAHADENVGKTTITWVLVEVKSARKAEQ